MWTSRCHLGWREICHFEGFLLGCLEERKVKTQKNSWEKETLQEGSHKASKSAWFVYCIPCFCSSFWLEKIALQLQNDENVVWFFVMKRWEFVDICTPWAVKQRQRWFGRLTSHPNGYFGERRTCFCFKNQPKILQNKKKTKKRNKTISLNNIFIFLHKPWNTPEKKNKKQLFPGKETWFKKNNSKDEAILSLFVCLVSWKMAMGGFSVVSTWGLKSSQHPRCL